MRGQNGLGGRAWLRLCLTVTSIGIFQSAHAGQVLDVTNPLKIDHTLSDLIAYGAQGEKSVILKPGDPSDDINFTPGMHRLFDAGFEVKRYLVSTTIGNSEFESVVFGVTSTAGREFSFLEDSTTNQPLSMSLDFGLTGYAPPPPGTLMSFVNGMNANLPGYFVGTSVNFDTGEVSGPFSGTGRFVNSGFVASVVPEPASWFMLGLGILGVSLRRHFASAQTCQV